MEPTFALYGWSHPSQGGFADAGEITAEASQDKQNTTLASQKKRTRGWGTTGPVAALEVWVFGGGEQPLKRSVSVLWGGRPRLHETYSTIAGVSTPVGFF